MPRISGSRGRQEEAGFALILTLIIILCLSVLTEMMTRWVSTALVQALAHQNEVTAKQQMSDAEALALYLLASRPISVRGIELLGTSALREPRETGPGFSAPRADNYVHLDDRPYQLDDVTVRFQDARGLINLNLGSDFDLSLLLGMMDVPAAARAPLISKLQDYTDADSLKRLNGAETPEYEAAGRPPPTNAPLRSPWEVRRVLGWDQIEQIGADDSRWPFFAATEPLAGFNIATTPRELLTLIPGMTPDAVTKILRWRNDHPITSSFELHQLTGLPIGDDPLRNLYYPGNSLILTLSSTQWPLERRIAVRLTGKARRQPWVIDYDVETPFIPREATQQPANDLNSTQFLSSASP